MFFIIKERKRYVKFALHQIKSAINFVFSKTVPLTFVASNSVELSNKKKLSLQEIAKEKFILTEENSIYHQSLLKMFVN